MFSSMLGSSRWCEFDPSHQPNHEQLRHIDDARLRLRRIRLALHRFPRLWGASRDPLLACRVYSRQTRCTLSPAMTTQPQAAVAAAMPVIVKTQAFVAEAQVLIELDLRDRYPQHNHKTRFTRATHPLQFPWSNSPTLV